MKLQILTYCGPDDEATDRVSDQISNWTVRRVCKYHYNEPSIQHHQHQRDLYHVFVDFKKAFDRVWHAALWATMRWYNVDPDLIKIVEKLYTNTKSALMMNGTIGKWFPTSVGLRHRCLLSPSLFNIFIERIMTDALDNHTGIVSIGGRTITNLRFADGIDGLAGTNKSFDN